MSRTITLPKALSLGHIPAGLTAPALRMALLLIGAADGSGRISMVKPQLERDAAVRLDNAYRSLERVRGAVVADMDGEGIAVFDDITYTPGKRKRLAGIVTAQLSIAFMQLIAHPERSGTLRGSVDELGRLTTIPGICIWLALLQHRQGSASNVRLRLRDVHAVGVFGEYASRATIERTNASGESFRWTSLSRLYAELVEPGVRDLWTALDDAVVDAVPGVPVERAAGRAWSHIDVTMRPLQKRLSLRELAEASKADDAYQIRKHQVSGR